MKRARTVRAFTLLELILSLTITALLSLTLYRSMSVCIKARATAQRAVLPVRSVTFALDLIAREFESVMPPNGVLAGAFVGVPQMGGSGSADYIEFYALGTEGDVPRVPTRDGIRHVALVLRNDVNPPVLVRQVAWNLLPRIEQPPEEEILCRGVRSIRFLYFDGEYWQPEWDSTQLGNVLPFAVQMDLEMETGDVDLMTGNVRTQHLLRIFPLPCAKLAEETSTDTGAQSSGTSGGGGTGGGGTSGGGTSGGGGGGRPR